MWNFTKTKVFKTVNRNYNKRAMIALKRSPDNGILVLVIQKIFLQPYYPRSFKQPCFQRYQHSNLGTGSPIDYIIWNLTNRYREVDFFNNFPFVAMATSSPWIVFLSLCMSVLMDSFRVKEEFILTETKHRRSVTTKVSSYSQLSICQSCWTFFNKFKLPEVQIYLHFE